MTKKVQSNLLLATVVCFHTCTHSYTHLLFNKMTNCHQRVVLTLLHCEFIKCALWKSNQPGGGPSTPLLPFESHRAFKIENKGTRLSALVEIAKTCTRLPVHMQTVSYYE